MAVTGGLEGMSVRHGLKEGGKSPFGVAHMAGIPQSGWQTGEKRVLEEGCGWMSRLRCV
jgi:hypothetical protein